MAAKKYTAQTLEQQAEEILSRLDVFAEYQRLGVRLAGEPRNNKCECYAAAREEKKPSAVIFGHSGRYHDSATGENLSLWDFAAKYGRAGFSDWQTARQHYADKAGVKLGKAKVKSSGAKSSGAGGAGVSSGSSGSGKSSKSEDPADLLEFLPWDDGCDRLARLWCLKHRKGASLEAVKLAGGRVGYLLYRDKKKKAEDGQPLLRRTTHKCIFLPCYGDKLLADDPVAWIAFDISGAKFEVYRGEGRPPDLVKMKAVGPTSGAMMGLHGLTRLASSGPDEIELIWKTSGPSDMLAVFSSILRDSPELIDKHLVVTNASGETGDVMAHQAALFAGHKAVLCPDSDEAGIAGMRKWFDELKDVAREVWQAKLPWKIEKKHGKDLRDFLNGVEIGDGEIAQEKTEAAP